MPLLNLVGSAARFVQLLTLLLERLALIWTSLGDKVSFSVVFDGLGLGENAPVFIEFAF